MRTEFQESSDWVCVRCDASLLPAKTKLGYRGSEFEIELMRCPVCHKVFIDESLALGKMLEVEKSLEDK